MTKFEIYRDAFEFSTKEKSYTIDELFQIYDENSIYCAPELLASFDNIEDAKSYYEGMIPTVSTRFFRSFAGIGYIDFDLIYIEENEYDDDDEWIDTICQWDTYIEPYTVNEED